MRTGHPGLKLRVLLLGAGILLPVWLCSAHFTWVAPAAGVLQVGKQATIGVFHGHHFPHAEEKIDATGASAKAIPPSGQAVPLTLAAGAKEVTAVYTPRQPGLHRIVYSQDRGVISRTPQGVKPGGRDRNPDAAQAYRVYRSSVAYLWAGQPGAVSAGPAGLDGEITAVRQKGEWVLTVYSARKPAAGVEVSVFHAGAKDEVLVGKTDAQGVLRYKVPGGSAGAVLFSADWKAKPPSGAVYDSVNYSTSLYVQN